MKLESNLPQHNSMLHAAAILDVVMLLLIFFLLGSKFVLRSGISVELPFSTSTLPPVDRSHVITVSLGPSPVIYFNEDRISLDELEGALEEHSSASRHVILQADRLASYGVVMEISDIILSHGYELAVATSSDRLAP